MDIKKAVIPAAGLGTRFLPATKVSPKEMLPLVDKPIIQYSVEEASAAGIKEVIIITGKGKRTIEDHFDESFELEHYLENRGKDKKILEDVQKISDLASFVYVRQNRPMGLGHAILTTKNVVGSDPFAVFLPDDVIISSNGSCIEQLMEVYDKYRFSVLALMKVEPKDFHRYGMVKVKKLKNNTYQVLDLVEKPKKISDSPSDLAIIGRYILTPKIFDCLEETKVGAGGELQVTDGLRGLLKHQPIYGKEFSGIRHDAGEKLGFIQATIALGLRDPELHDDLKSYLEKNLQCKLPKEFTSKHCPEIIKNNVIKS